MRQSRSLDERLSVALDLHVLGVDMMRQDLRRRRPGATEDEVAALLQEWMRSRRSSTGRVKPSG